MPTLNFRSYLILRDKAIGLWVVNICQKFCTRVRCPFVHTNNPIESTTGEHCPPLTWAKGMAACEWWIVGGTGLLGAVVKWQHNGKKILENLNFKTPTVISTSSLSSQTVTFSLPPNLQVRERKYFFFCAPKNNCQLKKSQKTWTVLIGVSHHQCIVNLLQFSKSQNPVISPSLLFLFCDF